MAKKITNPDVYKLRLASLRAGLDSIERWIDEDGGITEDAFRALGHVYDQLRSVQEHIVHGYPLVRRR